MSDPGRRTMIGGIAAGLIVVAVVGTGIVTRGRSDDRLATVAQAQAMPSVTLIRPTAARGESALALPAALQAYNSAAIFARTTGYVREWRVNIGDPVRRGQVLAVLDAPEVEQQLVAARADRQTARANERLAASTAARWDALLAKDAVSRQEADERRGELAARRALTAAAQANVARLRALTGFTRLRAPFDGIVTTRSAEIGALVVSGNAASQPLFTVADVRRIRAFVRVPQAYSAQVHAGMAVALSLPEYPGRRFAATMIRAAGAVDPASGTMLVELQAANADRALKPGAYAQATFPIRGGDAVTLPASALMVGEGGTRVAILAADGLARLRPVTIGRDLGRTVEISAGLSARDRVIDSPPDSLQSGDRVLVMPVGGGAADAAR